MFYKLLVERSSQFKNYTVERGVLEFVEPIDGEIRRLELDYSEADMDDFVNIIHAVWRFIMTLDLPDISQFSVDYKGILEFEDFLRLYYSNSIDI